MPRVSIEPLHIRSLKSTMTVVRLLRKNKNIRRESLFAITLDGFSQYHINIWTDSEDALSDIQCELNSNQELYNHYCVLEEE